MKQLQGNLLFCLVEPVYPELAGKITGMLLELSEEEVAELIASESKRAAAMQDAIEVLREAGDERAMTLVKSDAQQTLVVDVALATNMAGMRMSPRCGSMYSSRKLLASAGVAR